MDPGPEGEGERRDALIVATNEAGWFALARLLAEREVTPAHSFPPRCAVAALRASDVEALRRVPAVRVIVGVLPESEIASLPQELRLAIAGWNAHLRSSAGRVPVKGRGERWDAPGFLPPDPPATFRERLRRREGGAASGRPPELSGDEPEETA
jgi:hypothetical protein